MARIKKADRKRRGSEGDVSFSRGRRARRITGAKKASAAGKGVPDPSLAAGASMNAARKASVASVNKARAFSEMKDNEREENEAVEIIEDALESGIVAAYELTVRSAKSVGRVRGRIRKKSFDIKNNRDIKCSARTMRKADTTARTSQKALQEAKRVANETAKQAVITTEKIRHAQRTELLVRKSSEWIKKIVKGIIEGIKNLCTTLAAVSVPLLLVLVIAALVAGIVASAFGIFFIGDSSSGEDTRTLQSVCVEINQEYFATIEDIKNSVAHDELTIEGYQAAWTDILSVYAVYVTTGTEGATDVVHVTDENAELLRSIFWAMNTIAYTTEYVTETEQVPLLDEDGVQQTDDDGNLLYEEETITTTTLHITISHLSAIEEAAVLGFSDAQLAQLNELLDVRYASLWAQILRGVGAGTNELVNLALSQLGNEGGEKFWRWAGLEERCPWCALFVSWCADQTGLRASGQIPYFSFVTDGIAWFQENDKWIDGSEVDSSNYDRVVYPGMLVFFDWEQDGVPDHVGIITNAANGYIYTVEGNNGDAVVESLYSADSVCLYGFGVVG